MANLKHETQFRFISSMKSTEDYSDFQGIWIFDWMYEKGSGRLIHFI